MSLKNTSYWENKDVTSEEKAIFKYLKKKKFLKKPNVLHVGIGNSHGLINLKNKFNSFIGLTIAGLEKNKADKLNIDSNNNYLIDKHDADAMASLIRSDSIDYIIDINLKSFSPSNDLFELMIKNYVNFLKRGGSILTSDSGMKWTTSLSLKEGVFEQGQGNNSNLLSKDELYTIAYNNNLKVETFTFSIGLIKRKKEILYKLTKS
jgi:hypothetical protein|tara:strand:- start:206 stop:823 length:618 start_codon:yes stop_codon:yes gene_type:complete